LPRSQ